MTRLDHRTGLWVPAFTAEERKAKRARAMALLQVVFEGKASAAEKAELAAIDRDLYGPGSGWQEDKETLQHAKNIGREVLKDLRRRGLFVSTADVIRRGGTGGAFIDAADLPKGGR